MKFFIVSLTLAFVIGFSATAFATTAAVGSIKKTKGEVSIIRDGKSLQAQPGERLFQSDTLKTGNDGSMGVIFRDNTTLSLGPGSKIVIDEFVFSPSQSKFGMVTTMFKGTAVFFSGEIAKLAPEKVKIETPLATLGIRGTRFLVKVE